MSREKEQNQVLFLTTLAIVLLYIVFREGWFRMIAKHSYISWIALGPFALQIALNEWNTRTLRKKSPKYTNQFYFQNAIMVFINLFSAAMVLGLQTFDYEYSNFVLWMEISTLLFLILFIFFIDNSLGGFLSWKRIYFPKKWDQNFKIYGMDFIRNGMIFGLWFPILFQKPMSAFAWIFQLTVLLKASVIYTNKHGNGGWSLLLKILMIVQLTNLGFYYRNGIAGIAVGVLIAGVLLYSFRKLFENWIWAGLGTILYGTFVLLLAFYVRSPQSTLFYLQHFMMLLFSVFIFLRLIAFLLRFFREKSNIGKYSYHGLKVDKEALEIQKSDSEERATVRDKRSIPRKRTAQISPKTKKNAKQALKSKSTPKDAPKQNRKPMPKNDAKQILKLTPKNDVKQIPKQVQKKKPKKVPKPTPKIMPIETSKQMSRQIPKQTAHISAKANRNENPKMKSQSANAKKKRFYKKRSKKLVNAEKKG